MMRKIQLTAQQLAAAVAAALAYAVAPQMGSGGVHGHQAPYDPEDSRIRIGLTEEGTFYLLGKVTDWGVNSATSDAVLREWLGGSDLRPPRTLTKRGTVELFLDNGDTNGQVVAMTAHNNRTPVYLQVCQEGTTIGDTVYQVQCYITGYDWKMGGMDAAGITASMAWQGQAESWTEVVLAP
jgi:hypothetical protein